MNGAVVFTIAAFTALAGFGLPAAAETLPGPVAARVLRVLDGDTFLAEVRVWFGQVVTERVRILGIDAPEIGAHARCAEEAVAAERSRQFLAGLLGRGPVELYQLRRDKYGRALALVTAQGIDVSARMIEAGHARPYAGARRMSWC
jgi:endonuclease YncB( thermonuclease family)